MMKLLIDTNVIIDYLADRVPFADNAEKLFDLCADGKIKGILTASAVTDIYYVLRKAIGKAKAIESLRVLFDVLDIADIRKHDIVLATTEDFSDFEDALVSVCAKRVKADFIVTRNVKDFSNASVKPVTPEELLIQLSYSQRR